MPATSVDERGHDDRAHPFDTRLTALIPSTVSRTVVITILNGDSGRTVDAQGSRPPNTPGRGARCDSEIRNMGMVTVIAIILADLLVLLLYVYQYRQESGLTVHGSHHLPGVRSKTACKKSTLHGAV